MNKVACLSVLAGVALSLAPLSASAMIYNPAPGTAYYAAPQGYNSYFAGSQPQYYSQPTQYYTQPQYGTNYYQPQYYTQPSYTSQPVQYAAYGTNVTVQPINYQPFNQTISTYPQQQQQQQYAYYGQPQYGTSGYQPQYVTNGYYTQPSYGYSTGPYAGYYGANNPPIDVGYATGDHDTFGSPICYYPDYGRADCGSNPNQPVYDVWTGTWY